MAICREFYFPSSDGSSRIHAAEWTPESGEIIGVLQIAHGVAEYGMRYAPFAEFMTCTPCAAARRKNTPMFPIFSWATRWARF